MMRRVVDAELVRTLASFAQLEIPDEDMKLVELHLGNVLDSSERLDQLDLSDVEPIVTLDPRW
jgi:Asp-tRNA(Asn)/Glu-tRNA(Gln) amidotransferase C subunit